MTEHSVDESAVQARVRTHILDNFLLGTVDSLDERTSLMDSGILDSTGAMELVALLKSTFSITIDDDEIIPENLNSLARISDFVLRKSLRQH